MCLVLKTGGNETGGVCRVEIQLEAVHSLPWHWFVLMINLGWHFWVVASASLSLDLSLCVNPVTSPQNINILLRQIERCFSSVGGLLAIAMSWGQRFLPFPKRQWQLRENTLQPGCSSCLSISNGNLSSDVLFLYLGFSMVVVGGSLMNVPFLFTKVYILNQTCGWC